ncbi:hypothetical protein OA430_04305 [Candidatus Pelagibacter sp.]|nr:hypothetical protein [Candidatus Pelagibacter sp.]
MKKYLFIFILLFPNISFSIDVPTVDDFNNEISLNDNQLDENSNKKNKIPLLDDGKKTLNTNSEIISEGQEEVKVVIKKFIIEGNNSVSESEIQDLIKDFLNKELTLLELDVAAENITNFYIDKGLWARAVLPDQEIKNNEIKIKIIEAKLGKIIFQKNPDINLGISEKLAEKYLKRNLDIKNIFNINNLNKNIQLLDSLPGINSTASLQSGEVDGETDVIVEINETKLVSGNVKTDNHGSRSSGYARLSTALNFNGLFNLGESWSLQNVHTAGSDYYALGLTIPIGVSGLSATFRGSEMDYNLGIPLKSSNPDGNSDSLSMSLNFPSFNLGKLTTSINFGVSNNTYLNRTNSGISSEKSNLKGNLDLNFNIVDQIFGGGANNFTISMTKGELDLGDTPSNLASDQSAAKTNGDFEKFTFNFSRLQSLSSKHALFFSTNGQYGGTNLDPGEQLSLGGVSGIRGYPNSEASGSHGLISSLEYRFRYNNRIQTKIFYDFGKIFQYKDTYTDWNSSNTSLNNSYELSGTGFGVDAFVGDLGNLSLMYAIKLSSNPAEDSSGKDNDGTGYDERFWLSLSRNF